MSNPTAQNSASKWTATKSFVHCTEEPVKGKVNKEIIKEFTKLLHAKVELASGFTSKQKQFFVKGMGKQRAEQLLKAPT